MLRKALEAKGAKVGNATLWCGARPGPRSSTAPTSTSGCPPARAATTDPAQRGLLAAWLDAGKGRQIHFHWAGGTVDPDGLKGEHSAPFDRLYTDALDIDYAKLSAAQDRVISKLRAGEVHVTSPGGTDLRFELGDRPFNKQDGDASKARMGTARVRVDREIELPAGVVRVAPLEATVNGTIVIPAARFGDAKATGIRLEMKRARWCGRGPSPATRPCRRS